MANIYTLKSGLASDTTVWSGGVIPVSGDRVLIDTGHVVTVDGTYTWGNDTTTTITINGKSTTAGVHVLGTIKASRSVSSTLTLRGDMRIASFGSFDWGTEADPIPAAVKATIVVNFSSVMAHNKYGILNVTGVDDFTQFTFWGADKTPRTSLTASALAADTVVTVGDATGWEVGDFLAFGVTTTGTHTSIVYRAITAISGLNITLGGSLGADSQIGRTVLNLTRNVRVVGHQSNTWRSSNVIIRVANNPTQINTVEVGNAEFVGVGGVSDVYRRGALCITYSYAFTNNASVKKIYRPVCHDINAISGASVTLCATTANDTGILHTYRSFASKYTIEEPVCSSGNYISGITANDQATTIIKNAHVVGTRKVIATDFNTGYIIDGGWFEGIFENPIAQSVVDITYNNTTLNGLGRLILAPRIIGNQVFNSCNIGGERGMTLTPSAAFIENGQSTKIFLNDCTFHPSFTLPRTINLKVASDDTTIQIKNKNNDTDIQEIYRKGGKAYKDTTTKYRGRASFAMASWYSEGPLLHTTTVTAAPGETLRIRGYVRYAAAYTGSTPPKVTVTGLGITPVVFTCPSVADTWHEVDISVTNPQSYVGRFTLEFYSLSTANTETAIAWFDGFVIPDFVSFVRKYGDIYDTVQLQSTPNPFITQTNETTVGAYSGIAIDHTTNTLTISSNHTLQEIYDYVYYDLCQTANLTEPEWFTTNDGDTYACTYNVTLAGGNITGSGTIDMPANTFDSGTNNTTVVVYALNGNTGQLQVSGLTGQAVLLQDNVGTVLDYQPSVTGTYTYFISEDAVGTWKFTAKRAGYEHQVVTFAASLGGNVLFNATNIQKLTAEGLAMYTASTSALVTITFTGTTQGNIDIGNGTAVLQPTFDEIEVALTTQDGMEWLASGKSDTSIFNSSSGDYLFQTDNWRLRRAAPGDDNATLQAFAVSTQGVIVDGVNGGVLFLTSDTTDAIARAVIDAGVLTTGKFLALK